MLLNKINVLDHGWVALVSSYNSTSKLREISEEFNPTWTISEQHSDFCRVTLAIKCPLFFQLFLSKFKLNIVNTKTLEKLEAFKPDVTWIKSGINEIDCAISDDIYRTTDALLINPKAYEHDGCDSFTAHIMTPVNVYTTLLVEGSKADIESMIKCAINSNNNAYIDYANAIGSVIKGEWCEEV